MSSRRERVESAGWRPDGVRAWWPRLDTSRPHIRLGLLWFVIAMGAVFAGAEVVAAVYGLAAGLGALQIAKAVERVGYRSNPLVAGLAALTIPGLFVVSNRAAGGAVLLAAVVSVLVARGNGREVLVEAGATIRCWLFLALASGSVVAAAADDRATAFALVLLVSAYESGDYVFGSDNRWPALGPLMGMVSVAVFLFPLWAVAGDSVVRFVLVLALTAPLGQLAGSAILPDARALASGLRRVDTLLIAGPAWIVMLQWWEF